MLTRCWINLKIGILFLSQVVVWVLTVPSYSAATATLKSAVNYTFTCDLGIEAPLKRYFSPDQSCIQFRVSDRPLHQLTTRVTSIFFRDVLGYQNVCLVPYDRVREPPNDVTKVFLESFSKLLPFLGSVSSTDEVPLIADMEVLLPSGCSLHYDHVDQLEALGPVGRFSLLIPSKFVETNPVLKFSTLHWGAFHEPSFLSQFVRTDEFPGAGKNCSLCPIVLAKRQRDTFFLERALQSINVTLSVIYAEDDFEATYASLLSGQKPFLVFHWSHELQDVTLLQPPPCEAMKYPSAQCRNDGVCLLEPMTSLKIVSDTMKKVPIASQALLEVHFSREDYQELLGHLRESGKEQVEARYDEAACQWMKGNEKTWRKWKPVLEHGDKVEIKLAVYVPETLESRAIMGGFEKAITEGNRELSRVKLDLIREKDLCDVPGYASLLTQKLAQVRPDGLIGPSCNKNLLIVAENVQYHNTPLLSYLAKGIELKNKRKHFPNFFQVIGNMENYVNATRAFMGLMEWDRMAAIGVRDSPYASYLPSLNSSKLHVQEHLLQNHSEIWEKLQTIKKSYLRVIYVDVDTATYHRILCEARELKMTFQNDFIWLTPLWPDELLQYRGPDQDCAASMLDGTFFLHQSSFWKEDRPISANETISEWRSQLRRSYERENATLTDNHVGFAFDSIQVFVKVFRQIEEHEPWLLGELSENKRRQKVAQLIGQVDFEGMTGRVKFDSDGVRRVNINVSQWVEGRGLVTVGMFGSNGTGQLLMEEVVWAHDSKPDCVQQCRFIWRVECDHELYYYVAFFLAFAISMSFGTLYTWHSFKMTKLRDKEKNGLMVDRSIQIVPKDLVRDIRLGSGEFGEVWGAELKCVDKNGKQTWKRVAAKYLKTEAFYELRDFLYEAECLKQFSHKNIIKLEGVCIDRNIICIVLEFMLNGDLRRYLRNRRHLVHNRHQQKTSDISLPPTPRLLTSFAADIARALVYLEQKKKLHRDIASRNVLINAAGVAKLADFGFSRTVEDSGYYRLCRRGLMPIRWMPPEAIKDGKFSTASDVWAFGVLIYEIITFGDLPYKTVPDDHLPRSIAGGLTISLPEEIRPQLEEVVTQCWDFEPEYRCTPQQLLEFFTKNPKVVTPCVGSDMPQFRPTNEDSDYIAPSTDTTTSDVSGGGGVELNRSTVANPATSSSYGPFAPLFQRQTSVESTQTQSSSAPLLRYVKMCKMNEVNGNYSEMLEEMHPLGHLGGLKPEPAQIQTFRL